MLRRREDQGELAGMESKRDRITVRQTLRPCAKSTFVQVTPLLLVSMTDHFTSLTRSSLQRNPLLQFSREEIPGDKKVEPALSSAREHPSSCPPQPEDDALRERAGVNIVGNLSANRGSIAISSLCPFSSC